MFLLCAINPQCVTGLKRTAFATFNASKLCLQDPEAEIFRDALALCKSQCWTSDYTGGQFSATLVSCSHAAPCNHKEINVPISS